MSGLPWQLEFEPVDTTLNVSTTFDYVTGRLDVIARNLGDAPVGVGSLRLRATPAVPAVSGCAWLQGRFMQQDALIRVFGNEEEEGYEGTYVRETDEGLQYVSREWVALTAPARGQPAFVIGSLRGDHFFTDIEIDTDDDEDTIRAITIRFDCEAAVVAPGESLALPPLYLADGGDMFALAEGYADAVAEEMVARVPESVPTGWCSWYYFYNRVTEAEVVANLEEMQRTGHPAEYVQIDDGYQAATGDWLTPNEKFPGGMASLADRIVKAGYKPGLWLAPFVMHEDSAVLREHPEFALESHDGETLFVDTWLGRCAVLDCSHVGAAQWLHDVVATVTHDWGYVYLKFDALAFAAQSSSQVRYSDPAFTAPRNVRRGLEIIREAAGEDVFLLGCTCHFAPAVGLVDAMRVGPDVKATWDDGANPSVKHAMGLALQRNLLHKRWWINDPDCLLVRDTDTELNDAETRFLATSIVLSGGMVVASDDLAKLPPARRWMAEALFPPVGVAAQPLEPEEGPVPLAWHVKIDDERALIGVLNWSDEGQWVAVDEYLQPGEVAFDFWNARLLGKGDVYLQPHDATLWQVASPAGGPRVVGDSADVNYARLFQRPVSGRIQVGNELDRDRVIAIETRGRAFEVTLKAGEKRWFD